MSGGDLAGAAPRVHDGPPAHEAPDVGVEGAELLLDGQEGTGVADRRLDLGPVADDAGVGQELLHPGRREARHLGGVEVGEGLAVAGAALEDGGPAEAGLRPLEHQELEVGGVVVHRHAPLGVVVGDHLVALRPLAAPHAVAHGVTVGRTL